MKAPSSLTERIFEKSGSYSDKVAYNVVEVAKRDYEKMSCIEV